LGVRRVFAEGQNRMKVEILGSGDLAKALQIYRNLPRGQLLILPGTGHGTMMERPELVNLAIREFVERVDDGRTAR